MLLFPVGGGRVKSLRTGGGEHFRTGLGTVFWGVFLSEGLVPHCMPLAIMFFDPIKLFREIKKVQRIMSSK